MERTYIMIKPDGVERGLTGEIIKRFEQRGFQLLAIKIDKVRERERGKGEAIAKLIAAFFL